MIAILLCFMALSTTLSASRDVFPRKKGGANPVDIIPVEKGEAYVEEQHSSLCAKHAINNILQGHKVDKAIMDDICEEMTQQQDSILGESDQFTALKTQYDFLVNAGYPKKTNQELKFYLEVYGPDLNKVVEELMSGRRLSEGKQTFCDAAGNYQVEVIENVFRLLGINYRRLRAHEDLLKVANHPDTIGFLIHSGAPPHYFAVRKVEEQWVVLNRLSGKPPAYKLSATPNLQDIKHVTADGQPQFVITAQSGQLPSLRDTPKEKGENPQYMKLNEMKTRNGLDFDDKFQPVKLERSTTGTAKIPKQMRSGNLGSAESDHVDDQPPKLERSRTAPIKARMRRSL